MRKGYGDAFERALRLLAEMERDLGAMKSTAEEDFAVLLRYVPTVRRIKVNRALSRFKSPHLVDLLIEESRKRLTADSFEALELAECAHDVALRVPVSESGPALAMTCVARASAHRGNALRAAGDYKQAERLLEFAVGFFSQEGTGDPLVEAELLSLLASLRKDQRRFNEAHLHLDAAIEAYRQLNEPQLVGRCLVKKAVFFYEAGEPRSSIPAVLEALPLIDRNANARLYLAAEHNLTDYLQEVGRLEEARRRIQGNAALYDRFPDQWTQLRRQWVSGKIARGLGDFDTAEETLTRVRHGFTKQGLGFYAALAGLDLALIYIEQGRNDLVRDLAWEMVSIFMAQDIHREAAAALSLFEEAARRDAVTASMVVELAAYMRRVRHRQAEVPS